MVPNTALACLCLALFVVIDSTAQGQKASNGAAWVRHPSRNGFSVEYPPGWSAEGTAEGHVLIHSADRTAFALAHPFRATATALADSCLAANLKDLAALFPGAKLVRHESRGGMTLASITFADHGGQAQASVLCSVSSRGGMLYAIAAPTSQFAGLKPTLIRILNSFGYVSPGEGRQTVHAYTLEHISYTAWRDPHEDAYRTEVPRGWKVTGGLFRFGPVDARLQIEAGSPDGSVHILCGDATLGAFAIPGPSSQIRGLRNGQSYEANGVMYIVMPYADGARFSRGYIQEKLARTHSGLSVGTTRDRPDLADALNRRNAESHIPARVSVGETEFSYTQNGRTLHGICQARTDLWGTSSAGMWNAYASVTTAPAEILQRAMGVLTHMLVHLAENPQWSAAMRAESQRFTALVQRNHEIAMAQMRSQYSKYTRQMDENQRAWKNIINGEVDVQNGSGETFKAAAGHNVYWQRGGTIVGSDTGSPGINFTQLQRY